MTKSLSFARTGVVAVLLLATTACSNMDSTQQRMVSGAAAGAVIGGVGTVITGGCVACGAAIGGAVGTGAGYLIDKMDKGTKNDGGGY